MDRKAGYKPRVNGSLLGASAGKEVNLLAFVLKVASNSKTLEVKTTDNHCITVTMHQPLSEPLDGLVEFYGTSQGSAAMMCSDYKKFSEELALKFNMDEYNTALTLVNSVPNKWNATC